MRDTFEQSLRVLGLAPGATEQAVKEAYRDLVKVWHPDRFGSDARLRAKAEERLKEVTAAFEALRGYRPTQSSSGRPRDFGYRPPDSRASQQSAPTVEDAQATAVYSASRGAERLTNGPKGAFLALMFLGALAGIVGTWSFMSGRPSSQQPSVTNKALQAPLAGPGREPAAPEAVRRPQGEPPSSAVAPAPATASDADPATGSLSVTSRPTGARVSFDGRVVGETPVVVTNVTPGEHHIELDLDASAYQPWSSSVLVTAGHEERLLAVMTPREPRRAGSR